MRLSTQVRLATLGALVALAACGDATNPDKIGPPVRIDVVSGGGTGTVGETLPAPLIAKVSDEKGHGVPGVYVSFVVSLGSGVVTPSAATTDATGQAQAQLVLGTLAGTDEVTASVTGLTTTAKFGATAVAGSANRVAVSPVAVKIPLSADSARLNVQVTDLYGNVLTQPVTWTPRDATLLSVDATGLVRVLRRGGDTYVVASAGSRADSVSVHVVAVGETACTNVASPVTLAVGQVVTNVAGSGFCVKAATAGEEYAIIPFFSTSAGSSTMQLEVTGQGLGAPPVADVSPLSPSRAAATVPAPVVNYAFERTLRQTERAEQPRYEAAARQWYRGARQTTGPSRLLRLDGAAAAPSVGDLIQLNANANAYCSSPLYVTGRIAAITQKAIVVADTGNPAGGFSDAEYQGIGVTFDTLINPLDVSNFGDPTDIDGNGRVIILFTKEVNKLTPSGSPGGIVLGFFWGRDLLPKTGAGACTGSNAAEMFYMLVPDETGTINQNVRTKDWVYNNTLGTVAHEYQHLINAGRRMYVNNAPTDEETWLNEGLSHIAEELLFYRVSGLSPRANIGAELASKPGPLAAYYEYERNNAGRYRAYLAATEAQAPIGIDDNDDDLPTRGAVWSYLRYIADRRGATDGDIWFRLVNSPTAGMDNISSVLGTDGLAQMRDWAVSVFLDDYAPGVSSRFSQPSWNTRGLLPAVSSSFNLRPRALLDAVTQVVPTLRGAGVAFFRFTVPQGGEALLTVTSQSQRLPPNVLLAVVRTK